MTKINAIIVDFGKVLVDYDFDQFFDMLCAEYPLSDEAFNEFKTVTLDEQTYSSFDREETPFDEQIKALQAKHPACAVLFGAFNHRFQEVITGEVPGMYDLLSTLKRNGYPVYGLSNWSSKVYETMQNFPHIFSLLDNRVLSCEEHLLKPEADIYLRALERFGLKAEECVFVDDKQANIDGCRAVGIDGILFKGTDDLRKELLKRGINAQ